MNLYKFIKGDKRAFTLTEILLAVAIIGVIAALIIPATVAKFNESVLTEGLKRQVNSIKTAIDLLPVKENKIHFGQTSMYSDGTKSIEDTAGKFIKQNLRVSKYYGSVDTAKAAIKSECFANKYYEFSGGSKKEFTIDSWLVGACAKLKNGASLCLSPQIGANVAIQGVIDINGPKGPNVKDRDLRKFDFSAIAFVPRTSLYDPANPPIDPVKTPSDPGLTGGGYEDLCNNDYSLSCCNYFLNNNMITSPTHKCCENPAISSLIPICSNDITIVIDYYPTSACTIGNWESGSCKPYTENDGTFAKNGDGVEITTLPTTPPDIFLYCDGIEAGYMTGTALKSAVLDKTNTYTYFTKKITNVAYADRSCVYGGQSEGKVTGQASVTFPNGLSTLTQNGVNWRILKH